MRAENIKSQEAGQQWPARWVDLGEESLALVVASQHQGSWLDKGKSFLPEAIYFPSASISTVEGLSRLLSDETLLELKEQRFKIDFSLSTVKIRGYSGAAIFIAYPLESPPDNQEKLLKTVIASTHKVNTALKSEGSNVLFPKKQ